MIFCHRQVARELGMLGAFDELFLSLAGFGFRTIARNGLLPIVDLLLKRYPRRLVRGQPESRLA